MTVVTRFAPSPTGFLHIGGARTALFNWLYAKRHGGVFRLRIEDTDRARSTQAAVDALLDGLSWLGLDWDGEVVYQFSRAERHAAAAHDLLSRGLAYKCFATPEELEAMRAEQKAAGKPTRYDGRWRDRDPAEAPAGAPYVVRLRAPQDGATTVEDLVQGPVTVANDQLDDMVLLRGDGTPTYMLAVVVDDHDMGVTHVIRGDDHLTNTFRQIQLYRACGWDLPRFGHIPLIHGPDGAKLSKRHGALGVEAYRDLGYLPEALRNYLLRLGWGHGDEEFISTEQAIEWFDIDAVGRAPSRFDFTKLASVNAHYLKDAADDRLVDDIAARLGVEFGAPIDSVARGRIAAVVGALKPRAKTLVEMTQSARFLALSRPLAIDEKAAKILDKARALLAELRAELEPIAEWSAAALEDFARKTAESRGIKLGDVAQPLRCALAGATVSPPIFEVMAALGRAESLGRIDDCLKVV